MDISTIVNVVTKVTLLLMSLFLFGYVFLPEYRPEAVGLTLGTAAGMLIVRNMSMKVQQVAQMAVQATEKKRFNFGFITRICIALLVIMVAVKFEEVSLGSTIIGLFVAQLLILVVALVINMRQKQ